MRPKYLDLLLVGPTLSCKTSYSTAMAALLHPPLPPAAGPPHGRGYARDPGSGSPAATTAAKKKTRQHH